MARSFTCGGHLKQAREGGDCGDGARAKCRTDKIELERSVWRYCARGVSQEDAAAHDGVLHTDSLRFVERPEASWVKVAAAAACVATSIDKKSTAANEKIAKFGEGTTSANLHILLSRAKQTAACAMENPTWSSAEAQAVTP